MAPKKKPKLRRIHLTKPQHVQRLLSRTINELRFDELSIDKAKAVGYLSQCLIRCFEISMFETRLRDLEQKLNIET